MIGLLLTLAMPAAAQNQITIDGTGDSQELLRTLAQAFEVVNPGMQVVVPDSIGSSGGVKSLIKGNCDLARVARPLKDKERAKAADLKYRVFARSPVIFAANLPSRCLNNLTSAQLVGVLSGSLTDWSELGACPAHKIFIALREEGDSSRSVIEKVVPAVASIAQPVGQTIYSTPETIQTIADHAFTLGYSALAATLNHPLQIFSFNGIAPTEENVQKGSYPLVAPFGLVWRGKLSGLAKTFVEFIFSPAGEKIIRDAGVVPAGVK
ncbi:PstS family phosphate ABC transporter substrate-binding protein [Geopsychrobacter electrodiphilus]|uniref:PstS family phosphate ABC transporter substrate-binding protein n=1 Tax=Geopsychrobacter electrodiphilus TaxID=225196 RepID=UPI001469A585|nr:substrate-binding domain-containing protein [Geopsychrobacter electrodiphilus]